jgi:flagellar biosynthesis protein FlhB
VSDVSEKPFEATPRRIAKAQREGNVARANELAANVSFAAAGITLAAIVPVFGSIAAKAIASSSFGAISYMPSFIAGVALAPIAAAAVGGTFGTLLQNGGFAGVNLALKLERLDPFDGLKRICSRDTLAHSLRACLAFVCAAAAMAPLLAINVSALLRCATLNEVAAAAWMATRQVATAACAVGCCFAIAEYAAARRLWLQRLRMTFDERKREAKEEEGDASARGRRRALHRALLRGGMQRLKEAALIVANPRHVAVALEYRPPDVPVPRVLVRAADAAARRVRAAAARYGIPIVENVWLARALYGDGRAGEPIPHGYYVAVAEVIAALMRAKELRQ